MTQDHGNDTLLPFTILDAMILIAAVAVSLSVFAHTGLRHVRSLGVRTPGDWAATAEQFLVGPTYVGPIVIGVQFFRGRRRWILPGELCWIIFATLPMMIIIGIGLLTHWAIMEWTWPHYARHPFTLACAVAAVVGHFQLGQPKHWSHRLGLFILIAQCAVAVLNILRWFAA